MNGLNWNPMTDVLKSKYEVKSLIFEDLISFCYEGKTHYSEHSILIWKYKSNYLSSALVTRLINVSEKLNPIQTWIYVQNNRHTNNVWHNHVNTSSVNAVYYIDPPSEGGGLQLTLGGRDHTIKPEINKLYLFPYWMEHRPLPQESKDWRVSVNIEYLCLHRPIYKILDVLW